MEQAGVALIAQGSSAYNADMKAATNATNTFVDATEKGGHRVGGAGQVMIGALRQVGVVAVQAFGQALRAGAAFIGDSIKLAGDFEQTMNVLQATSDATAQEMGAVSAKAKALGADLTLPATSAVDAGKAMLELSKAGFTVAESMDAAKGVLQLAAAAQIDEAQAAEINANAINAFNLEAKDSIFISDLLAASANASSVEIKDVGRSYQMAGAIFANFQGPVVGSKQAIIDLTTAVGLLGNSGVKGSDAGTSLKQALLQLTGPSEKAKGLMKSLAQGIGLAGDIAYTAQGKMRSFPEILRITAAATKDLTDEKRNQYITDIFGADASRAILILMRQGPEAWAAMETAVTKQGAAADLAAAKTKGYKGAIEGAKSQIETFQLTLASGLMPILADLINTYITPSISALNDFITPIVSASDPILAFASALHQWDGPLGSIAFYLVELARGGEGVSAWLKETPPLFQGLVGGVQDAIAEFSKLSDAFNTGGISGLIDQVITDISAALPDIEAALMGWGQALIDWIAPMIPPALDELDRLVNEALAWVVDQAPLWADQLSAWGDELVAWIAPMIPPALDELGKMGAQFLEWIGAQASVLLGKFLDWKDAFVAWIPGATVTFLAEWPKMFDEFLDWIGEAAGPLLLQLGDWALSFTEWIVPMIPGFLQALGAITIALGVFIVETAVVLGKKVAEWTVAMTGWIVTEAIPRLLTLLGNLWTDFNDWGIQVEADIGSMMMDVGTSLVDGIKHGVMDAWGSFKSWISGRIGSLVDSALEAIGAGSPATAWMPVGQFAVQGVMAGFEAMMPKLTSLVSGLGDDLARQAADIAANVQNSIGDAFGSTADINRQKITNMKAVGALDEVRQAGIQQEIDEAEKIALAMNDPEQAAAYFKMRSAQLIEMGKLNDQINAETDAKKRDQLVQQYWLLNSAHAAELAQMQAQQKASSSDTQKLIDQIQALLHNKDMPAILDDPIVAALFSYLQQLRNAAHRAFGGDVQSGKPYWVGEKGPELFWPGTNGSVMPAASSAQLAGGGNTTNNSSSRTFNMPIYTNNSPAALQQSMAIMQAGMV